MVASLKVQQVTGIHVGQASGSGIPSADSLQHLMLMFTYVTFRLIRNCLWSKSDGVGARMQYCSLRQGHRRV